MEITTESMLANKETPSSYVTRGNMLSKAIVTVPIFTPSPHCRSMSTRWFASGQSDGLIWISDSNSILKILVTPTTMPKTQDSTQILSIYQHHEVLS
jgi:hypothetical protein